jgi:phage-related protein
MTLIKYFTNTNIDNLEESPPKLFINSLNNKQKAKIFRIFSNIENYGLSSIQPHIKKVIGTPLWEIRILGQDNIRIIYVTKLKIEIIVLHAFFKKIQKTPQKEIDIALI